jgi:thymidylate synthase (FAD)
VINVLDHGFVRIVSYMQPPLSTDPDPDFWSGDLEVVRNARVSYDADWRTGEEEGKDAKLVDYLYRNHHSTPFEAMVFTFEVKAPIFVVRQWHRHRTWSYNEVSARYTPLPAEYYVPDVNQITAQSKSNKQMRTDEVLGNAEILQNVMRRMGREAHDTYNQMIEAGCPRELARTILPLSTYTRMFATVDLHNLFHFLRLRLHEHAQYEIRVYAAALLELIEPIVPVSVAAFKRSM